MNLLLFSQSLSEEEHVPGLIIDVEHRRLDVHDVFALWKRKRISHFDRVLTFTTFSMSMSNSKLRLLVCEMELVFS